MSEKIYIYTYTYLSDIKIDTTLLTEKIIIVIIASGIFFLVSARYKKSFEP